MAERNIWKALTYTLFFGVVALTLIFSFAMKDGMSCIGNPLVYGAEKLTTEETGGLLCSCSLNNPKFASFNFDAEGIRSDKTIPTDYPIFAGNYNFSPQAALNKG